MSNYLIQDEDLKPNPLAIKSGDDLPFSKHKQAGRTFYSVAQYKKMDAPESELQGECEDYLKELHLPYIHIPPAAYKTAKVRAGIPDLIISQPLLSATKEGEFIYLNSTLFIELKKKGGKPRQGQKNFARHANVYLVYNFPDFKELVDKFVRI